jgi:hypothetical protein
MAEAVGAARRDPEQVLVAPQRRVVVVLAGAVVASALDVARVEQDGADASAAIGRVWNRQAELLEDRGQQRREARGRLVGPWGLPAAGGPVGAIALVERHDDQHLALAVCGRGLKQRVQWAKNSSAPCSPPAPAPICPIVFGPTHVLSCPSSHRLGVIQPNFGVVQPLSPPVAFL